MNVTCDDITHCKTGLDEKDCNGKLKSSTVVFNATDMPAVIDFNRPGTFSLVLRNNSQCPESHFQCPGEENCLPLYTLCNGMNDCPGHEDEAECHRYVCNGFYRCRGSKAICMHVQHLCDGYPQCPEQDDELMCHLNGSCLENCVCYGLKVFESMVFQADSFPKIRYLEGEGSGLTLDDIRHETMLVYLGAGECRWGNISYMYFPNLHVLDISNNLLQHITVDYISDLSKLKELDLSGNPLTDGFVISDKQQTVDSLLLLNLSQVSNTFSSLFDLSHWVPHVEIVDFSFSNLRSLAGIELFKNLKTLKIQGCHVSVYKADFMKQMNSLQEVFADDFKLCCPAILPSDLQVKCFAPADKISSCDNLLKLTFHQTAFLIFAIAALLGNIICFAHRVLFLSGKCNTVYTVFVLNLYLSDLSMGIYLAIICSANHLFAGCYVWKEIPWKRSTTCHIAGSLSLVSCEVSSVLICLISLDRFLVIRFPFSRFHFRTTSAQVACIISWGMGVILASIPLLPVTSHWAFYSQTGICIPLPITRADFPGRHYSFSVMIVFNLVLFTLIVAGQALVYWTITTNTMYNSRARSKDDAVSDKSRLKEAAIARRFLVIALSNSVCWFPIGVIGLLTQLSGLSMEVNIALAIFINPALNPFLYSYMLKREKIQREKETKVQKFIKERLKNQGNLNK